MKTYSAYFHEDHPLDGSGLILIRESFPWFALFLPLFWALRHQLWQAFFIYLALTFVIQGALEFVGAGLAFGGFLVACFRLVFASGAPIFRHRKLMSRGYRELEAVRGANIAEAERRVLDALTSSLINIEIESHGPIMDREHGSDE